jgi:hypothetical protein
MDTSHFASLATFRAATYAALGRRRDALFALCDRLLTTGPVPSLPLLTIQPQHQRKWGSLYDALAAGWIGDAALEHLLSVHPLDGGEGIDAVAVSVWPRCDAPDQSRARALLPRLAPLGRGSPSSPVGRLSGSPRSASRGRAGQRRCACGDCAPRAYQRARRRADRGPSPAPADCGATALGPLRRRLRPRPAHGKRWETPPPPSWFACAPDAAFTATRPPNPGPVGPVGTATRSPVTRR